MLRAPQEWLVRKRDSRVVPFDLSRLQQAIASSFRAELNLADGQPLDTDVLAEIALVAESVADDIAPFAGDSMLKVVNDAAVAVNQGASERVRGGFPIESPG